MTPEQQAKLREELINDPGGRGYAQHLPDDPVRVVELLTALTESKIGPLRTTTAKAWSAHGPRARIEDAAEKGVGETDHPCRASCLSIRESLITGDFIHVEDEEVQEMLADWVATHICSQAEVDDLYRRATQPASRADVLGIPAPTARDITDALKA
jgi:hypothetical protein